MQITHLKAATFRNIKSLSIAPGKHINIIYGENGSGKTSILETIHFLGLGRSFRTHRIGRIIQYEQPEFIVFAKLGNAISVGIEKQRRSKSTIRINGDTVPSAASLAENLPLQLATSESFKLLSAGPKYRREFIDWGLFHVEHRFFPLWKRYHKALKQRNASIRSHMGRQQIVLWDEELVSAAEEIEALRQQYMGQLSEEFSLFINRLVDIEGISFCYQQGWEQGKNLKTVLDENFQRDSERGYTQFGCHRSDMLIMQHGYPVQDVLSRGQQKVLVYALRLAQGSLLKKLTDKQCVYLIDDLPAELDQDKRARVMACLDELGSQVFVTGIYKEDIASIADLSNAAMFHVKHGAVSQE